LPVDITVTAVGAAGPRPLDDYLAGGAGSGAADVIAVPVRRDQVRAAAGGGDGAEGAEGTAGDGGWSSVAGFETEAVSVAAGISAAELIAAFGLSGKAGEVTRVPARTADGVVRLILLGVGDGSPADLRRAGAALARQVEPGNEAVAVLAADATDDDVHAFTEGVLLGGYTFSLRSGPGPDDAGTAVDPVPPDPGAAGALAPPGPGAASPAPGADADGADGGRGRSRAVRLLTRDRDASQPAGRAAVVAGAVALARDLVNMPSLRKTPEWLAGQAAAVAGRRGLDVRVRDEEELASEGFGGILAVGAGSARPPRMIELTYTPPQPDRDGSHVVLAGKGITFDSGGLSLKPNDNMKSMKTDMSGGATVIAVMSALAALGVRSRVTGLVGAAENMPSGSAMRPGDIITAYGGRTIEVLNTDAEGRLVLADLLAYAGAVLHPDVTVDIATLTGAARVALGGSIAALYASEDGLAEALSAAGTAAGEPVWQMPMPADYADALTSVTADVAHIPSSINGARNGQAGSIVAAMFLREFTAGRPWAHLDVAGPARATSDDGEITKGGTGFGTRLLLRWLAGASY
jgi:leucyl aminopeptidase